MNKKQNKKRIAFIIGSMRRGGAERVISILANSYAEKGWSVDILTLLDDSNDYVLNSTINVKLIFDEGQLRVKQILNWIFTIRKYVIKNKPDVIVSFIARINIITLLACFGLNKRIIISERNDPTADGRTRMVKVATNLLYPLANCIVFQTKWAQSCFFKKIQNKGVIIPNPIHVTSEASSIREKKIVAVGRLYEQKNHEMLIRVFKKVHDDYPDYKLYIYGEGKLREKLTKQVEELELINEVFLPGNILNIHDKIKDAEIFVLSSNYEGLSNALLEAMMMGLPCISTNCAGSNEVIKNGKNGLIIPIRDENELLEKIELLINDKKLSENISKEAKKIKKIYNSEKVLKDWEEIIENKD